MRLETAGYFSACVATQASPEEIANLFNAVAGYPPRKRKAWLKGWYKAAKQIETLSGQDMPNPADYI